MKTNKHKTKSIKDSKKESRIALLTKLIERLDDDSSKLTSGQIRMYLWDAVSVK